MSPAAISVWVALRKSPGGNAGHWVPGDHHKSKAHWSWWRRTPTLRSETRDGPSADAIPSVARSHQQSQLPGAPLCVGGEGKVDLLGPCGEGLQAGHDVPVLPLQPRQRGRGRGHGVARRGPDPRAAVRGPQMGKGIDDCQVAISSYFVPRKCPSSAADTF